MSTTEQSATEYYEYLKARMVDGETVSVAELAEAKAAADHEALVDAGKQTIRERLAARRLAGQQDDAKARAADIVTAHPIENVCAAYDSARDAVDALIGASDDYNAALAEATTVLTDGRVDEKAASREPLTWADHPHGILQAVYVDGVRHSPQRTAAWVARLWADSGRDHSLTLNGGSSLEGLIGEHGRDTRTPGALLEHLRDAA
ncbi:hypothetical protein BJD99_19125 [Rhodococcus sp. 1163]|uniref:hypothetical protein n=1 Tax=Rhodococcus sp. 1163 TaxID=1905289 RepID=UPI0009FEEA34|nr:hypothetical protein [Rhodococcus sp. 1163]ORI18856.1 hypothetical protein BJD99_19125 [Rhodococcus sp. 1163]